MAFDIDMINLRFAPGSGTLVRGGTTYREGHLALEIIAEGGGMRSFDLILSESGKTSLWMFNTNTGEIERKLILSALCNWNVILLRR